MSVLDKAMYIVLGIYILLFPILPGDTRIFGIPFNGDIILALFLLIFLVKFMACRDTRKLVPDFIKSISYDYVNLSLLIFVLIMFVSITYSNDKVMALKESLRYTSFILLFIIIKYNFKSRKMLSRLLKLFLLSSSIVFVCGVFEYFYIMLYINKGSYTAQMRIISVLEQSNNVAAFSLFIIFPSIMLFIISKNKRIKTLYGILTFMGVLIVFFSGSRNAMLGLIFGILVLSLIYNYKIIYFYLILPILFIIPQFRLRFRQIADMSQNVSRIKIWKAAIYMIKDHPFRGVGMGNYYTEYPEYIKLHPELINTYDKTRVLHPHNILLKFQSELGIIGTLSFISFIYFIFKSLSEYLKGEKDEFLYNFYRGFAASLSAFLFMNMIDNFFSAPKVIAFFWIITGIMEGIRKISKQELVK